MNQQTLIDQRQTLTRSLDQIHAEHAALAAKLVDQPGDFDLLDAVHAVRQKLDATQARIDLFDEASDTHATKSAQAQRIATAVAARDEAIDLAAKRVIVAKRLDAVLAEFQKVISEYASLNEQAIHAAKVAVKNAGDASLIDVQRAVDTARSYVNDALVTAFIRSDLERVAPRAVKVSGQAGTATVEDVAKLAGDRLATLLDAALRGDRA